MPLCLKGIDSPKEKAKVINIWGIKKTPNTYVSGVFRIKAWQ
jgi:hypothetical protein